MIESQEAGSHVIILGYFNEDVRVCGGSRATRAPTLRGMYVMNFFYRHGLIPMNMQPFSSGPVDTFECHNGHSTIDYFAVPSYLKKDVCQCCVNRWDALNTYDHRDVQLTMKMHIPFTAG